MDKGLRLEFHLDKEEFIWGETILFSLVLSHNFTVPVNVITFEPANRSVVITLKDREGKEIKASEISGLERDGIYIEPPRMQEGKELSPEESLRLTGDLLSWFGYIPEGLYTVTAHYKGILRAAMSRPVEIRIIRANITSSIVAREGLQAEGSLFSGVFVHREKQDSIAFFQELSSFLPRNPRMGIPVAVPQHGFSIHAACLPGKDAKVGHLYWKDENEKVFFAGVNLIKKISTPPKEIKPIPFPGDFVESALSMKDGSLLIPFSGNNIFAVLRVPLSGDLESHELDLGTNFPMGPNVCFWEQDLRLHFGWTRHRGRQLDYVMLPLDDDEFCFAKKTVHISYDPIVWVDAYFSAEIPQTGLKSLYLGGDEDYIPPPPELIFMVVSAKPGALVCTPVNAARGFAMDSVTFSTGNIKGIKIISSVVTNEYSFSFLMKDNGGRLYYASTLNKKIVSMDKFKDKSPAAHQFPCLIKGGAGAMEPWVHLRYVNNGSIIEHIRLEPELEPDPVEKLTEPWDSEALP